MKPHIRRIVTIIAITLVLSTFGAFAQSANADKGVDLIWGVKIPMRDGVKLNATVFKPKNQTAPLPVIFTFTPYISDTYEDRAVYFARNGYVYALIDVRGRGNSEGHFEPFVNEGRDGYDVVEWLQSNRGATAKSRCGEARMQASINGQRSRKRRLISLRLFRLRQYIQAPISHSSRASSRLM